MYVWPQQYYLPYICFQEVTQEYAPVKQGSKERMRITRLRKWDSNRRVLKADPRKLIKGCARVTLQGDSCVAGQEISHSTLKQEDEGL